MWVDGRYCQWCALLVGGGTGYIYAESRWLVVVRVYKFRVGFSEGRRENALTGAEIANNPPPDIPSVHTARVQVASSG